MTDTDHTPGYRNTLRALRAAGGTLNAAQLATIGEDPTNDDGTQQPHREDAP